jgi:hypothetical protein
VPTRTAALATLRAIVAEAVIRQDAAEQLLGEIRERRPLADLAPRGGVLVSRFVGLRRALPDDPDPELRAVVTAVAEVLDHHALLVSSALDLLSVDWRSDRMIERLGQIGGLGPPAERLEAIWSALEDGRLAADIGEPA